MTTKRTYFLIKKGEKKEIPYSTYKWHLARGSEVSSEESYCSRNYSPVF
jgi:hypothetical protein